MSKLKLQIAQMEKRFEAFSPAREILPPSSGWVKAVRNAIGMSMQQLANRLSISKQSVLELERREFEGSITIRSLREAARALDMELVYGFVPKDGSLQAMIDRHAQKLAAEIVARTSNTMKLEDQENSQFRIRKAVEERTAKLKENMPKILWD